MENNYRLDLTKKEQKIVLIDKKFIVKPSFSVGSYSAARKIITETGNYKQAFHNMILNKFADKITEEDLQKFDNNDYEEVIKLFLNNKEAIEFYNKCSHEDIFKDFFETINFCMVKKLSEVLEKNLPSIMKGISCLYERVAPNIINILNTFSKKIKEAIDNFKIEDSEVAEPLKKWASYGWTIPNEAPINLFFQMPESLEYADKICINFFDEKDMKTIFEEIKKNPDIIPSYFDDSVELYLSGKYRASAMLIIACIDKVLSSNIVNNKKTNHKKQIGFQAVKQIRENMEKKEKDFILNIFVLYNLLEYLGILFFDGEDFNNEPENVNRNYLMHGWQEREISKIDCIKLFNATNLLVQSIDDLKLICSCK